MSWKQWYSNLTGPEEVASAGGAKYIMNVLDDYLSMTWIYLLKKSVSSDSKPSLSGKHLPKVRPGGRSDASEWMEGGSTPQANLNSTCVNMSLNTS